MAYEVEEDAKTAARIERMHDDLATEHGRDNVLIKDVGGYIVTLVGDEVGTVDPLAISIDPCDIEKEAN